jgi:thiamine-monophosphate kinase
MKEFDLIKQYFANQPVVRKDVVLGIGDDCAIVKPIEHQQIAITTDTLVAGVHFPENTPARAIGHKSVAVSLSDLAAMGAEPSWISLAITLPKINEEWAKEFCAGVFELCDFYNVQLIGGDTTQGPLSITITAQGYTPVNKQITRAGAKAGDWLYVSGTVGDAALALRYVQKNIAVEERFRAALLDKLNYPKPRVLAGQVLRQYASAAIDISDGLAADLSHLCAASKVGVNLVVDNLPLSEALIDSLAINDAYQLALTGGDDYELLFTVSEDNKVGMETALANTGVAITCIGQLNSSQKIKTLLNGETVCINLQGFEHFNEPCL